MMAHNTDQKLVEAAAVDSDSSCEVSRSDNSHSFGPRKDNQTSMLRNEGE